MIDLYYWHTPNGHKITVFLEEAGVPYALHRVNIDVGEQFNPAFLKISPNNRIPAIVDSAPNGGGAPINLFESGAILLYLADKTGKFVAPDLRGRTETLQWLFWQMAGLGPMGGQNGHFNYDAPEKIPYAMSRYINETGRLYGVLNKCLADRDYVAGDYSIADMAIYPWIMRAKRHKQNIDDFPHLKRWFNAIKERPAVIRAYGLAPPPVDRPITDEIRKVLYGQSAQTVTA